jgi:uncharacterized membrane protein
MSAPDMELRHEARREAAPVLGIALAVQVLLALISYVEGWELLNRLPWWIWLVLALPELVLLVDLVSPRALARTRRLAIVLLGTLVLGNLAGLAILVGGLVSTSTKSLSGGELLLSGFAIWLTNAIVFGLWFWEVDNGGPVARMKRSRKEPDFQFPQDENPQLAADGWAPSVWDYLYVSLTNSIAFSPTDTMPVSLRAKALMGAESAISAATVLLVAARAVNVLGA